MLTGGIGGHPAGCNPFLVDIQSGTVGKNDIHDAPHKLQAGGISSWRESPLRALLPGGSWRQWVVPSDIRVQLLYRRAAPSKKRPRDQPLWRRSLYCCLVAG